VSQTVPNAVLSDQVRTVGETVGLLRPYVVLIPCPRYLHQVSVLLLHYNFVVLSFSLVSHPFRMHLTYRLLYRPSQFTA